MVCLHLPYTYELPKRKIERVDSKTDLFDQALIATIILSLFRIIFMFAR
jgi:hypothetical protein